ncbi:hypothetical protein ACLB1T_01665 [Escherichia coli]
MDVTPLMRVDGFAMLYTGLVLLASLATCTFAYPWLEGYNDNKDEFYLLVLIAALWDPAGECQPSGVFVPRY